MSEIRSIHADDIEVMDDGVRLVLVEPACEIELVHEQGGFAATEACIPRISLDCSSCHASVIFCHLSMDVVNAYVDPGQPRWRCQDCEVQP